MKLKDRIGSFIQLSDIPMNSKVMGSIYGLFPVFLLNKLYKTCIGEINLIKREIDEDPITMPYSTTREAFEDFRVFNIVDDVEKAVVNNLEKGIKKAVPIHTDAEEYINRFSNNYFKFRREQMDCGYIITAFDSELSLFADRAGINVNIPYNQYTTFRTTSNTKPIIIANERAALKRIKQLFNTTYDNLRAVIYALQKQVLKLRSTEDITLSDDLEL